MRLDRTNPAKTMTHNSPPNMPKTGDHRRCESDVDDEGDNCLPACIRGSSEPGAARPAHPDLVGGADGQGKEDHLDDVVADASRQTDRRVCTWSSGWSNTPAPPGSGSAAVSRETAIG
jgi:hypothetical protein